MTTTTNGSVRKSLAEQIDRLDTILDGLAEGLSSAVADAVRDSVGRAVQEAVQAVLVEMLTNPVILDKLRGTVAPPAPPAAPAAPKAPKIDRVTPVVNAVKSWASAGWAKVREVCAQVIGGASETVGVAGQYARLVWAYRTPLLASAVAGLAIGVAAYFAGPWVAATAASIAGFTAATSAQLAITLRRILAQFGVENSES